MEFFKKSVNWLCLVNNDYHKNCSVHRFLIEVEQVLMQSDIKKQKVNDFLKFTKEKEEIFIFIHDFYAFSEE